MIMHVLYSLATPHGLIVHHMDVKTVVLNRELEEEIYMDQHDDFVANGQEENMWKLLKSLYVLKQSPKKWHEIFYNVMTSVEFVVNEAHKCVYYWFGREEGMIFCLCVDVKVPFVWEQDLDVA